MQVVVEQPGQRRSLLVLGVARGGEIAGVGAQQVMHGVPPRSRALDQVGARQQAEQALGLPHANQADIASAWRRIRSRVRNWTDLEPELISRVEELIDFVTAR